MGSQDQHRQPDLFGAVAADLETKRKAADERPGPNGRTPVEERAERAASLDHDATLHGTAGWDALSPARRSLVARHVAAQSGTEAA